MFKMWSLEYGEVLWENLEKKTGGLEGTGSMALVVFESLLFRLSLMIYITIYIFDDHHTSSKTLLSDSTLWSSIRTVILGFDHFCFRIFFWREFGQLLGMGRVSFECHKISDKV